jgi:hypothetical protein
MLLPLMLMLAAEPAATAAAPAPEASCSMVVETDGQKSVTGPVAGLTVLGGPDQIAAAPPAGAKLIGVMCHRASIIPDARDGRVLRQLGVPLYIATGALTGVLKLVDGAIVYRPVGTAWDAAIQPQIDAIVAAFNAG